MSDERRSVELDWATSTAVVLGYKINDWLRMGQRYALLPDQDKHRHLFRTNVSFTPDLPVKRVKIPQRLAFQLASRERKGKIIFEHDFSARSGVAWEFKRDHELYTNATINGAFDERIWEWDRLRLDAGLQYSFHERHSFNFSYRYQKRLTGKRRFSHGVGISYSVEF